MITSVIILKFSDQCVSIYQIISCLVRGLHLLNKKNPGLLLNNMYLLNKEDPGFSISKENNPGF